MAPAFARKNQTALEMDTVTSRAASADPAPWTLTRPLAEVLADVVAT